MLSSEESAGTLLASAARTVDTYGPEMNNNKGYKGILLVCDCTVDGGGTVTPRLQYLNPATKEWEVYKTGTAAAVGATGETQWIIYPLDGLATALGLTLETPAPIPMVWRLFMDVADANSMTYSVGYQYLP